MASSSPKASLAFQCLFCDCQGDINDLRLNDFDCWRSFTRSTVHGSQPSVHYESDFVSSTRVSSCVLSQEWCNDGFVLLPVLLLHRKTTWNRLLVTLCIGESFHLCIRSSHVVEFCPHVGRIDHHCFVIRLTHAGYSSKSSKRYASIEDSYDHLIIMCK